MALLKLLWMILIFEEANARWIRDFILYHRHDFMCFIKFYVRIIRWMIVRPKINKTDRFCGWLFMSDPYIFTSAESPFSCAFFLFSSIICGTTCMKIPRNLVPHNRLFNDIHWCKSQVNGIILNTVSSCDWRKGPRVGLVTAIPRVRIPRTWLGTFSRRWIRSI